MNTTHLSQMTTLPHTTFVFSIGHYNVYLYNEYWIARSESGFVARDTPKELYEDEISKLVSSNGFVQMMEEYENTVDRILSQELNSYSLYDEKIMHYPVWSCIDSYAIYATSITGELKPVRSLYENLENEDMTTRDVATRLLNYHIQHAYVNVSSPTGLKNIFSRITIKEE